jgi:hypothetical protein
MAQDLRFCYTALRLRLGNIYGHYANDILLMREAETGKR